MDNKNTEEVLLCLQLAFFNKIKKKNLQKIWDFWGFLKFSALVAKSDIGTQFYTIFLNIWRPSWPWIWLNIEMGNLEARTPCVKRTLTNLHSEKFRFNYPRVGIEWVSFVLLAMFECNVGMHKFLTIISALEIKPCGLGSRIRDVCS